MKKRIVLIIAILLAVLLIVWGVLMMKSQDAAFQVTSTDIQQNTMLSPADKIFLLNYLGVMLQPAQKVLRLSVMIRMRRVSMDGIIGWLSIFPLTCLKLKPAAISLAPSLR